MTQKLEKYQHYLFLVFAFILPIHPRLSVFCIILLCINQVILTFSAKNTWKRLFSKKLPLLFSSLYLLYLLGYFLSNNQQHAFIDLGHKLSFIVFPFLVFSRKITPQQVLQILFSFVYGCLATAVFCWVQSAVEFISSGNSKVFFYSNLSNQMGLHPTYIGIYTSFSIFILLLKKDVFQRYFHQLNTRQWNLLSGMCVLLLTLFLLMLNSRMQILVFLLLASFYFLYKMYKVKKIGIGLLAIVVVGFALSFVIQQTPSLKIRFKKLTNTLTNKKGTKEERIKIWESTWQLIQQRPLIGYSNGDTKQHLQDIYQAKKMTRAYNQRYNPHNQYLQYWLSFGVSGLLLFLGNLLYPLFLAKKHQHSLYLLFLMLFSLSFLAESLLEMQTGIVFFTFFNSLLASQLPANT